MSWLISDAVASIREQLQDTRAGSYRYSDVKLLRYLNSAFSDVRRLRPDLLLPTLDVPAFVEADLLTPQPSRLTGCITLRSLIMSPALSALRKMSFPWMGGPVRS